MQTIQVVFFRAVLIVMELMHLSTPSLVSQILRSRLLRTLKWL